MFQHARRKKANEMPFRQNLVKVFSSIENLRKIEKADETLNTFQLCIKIYPPFIFLYMDVIYVLYKYTQNKVPQNDVTVDNYHS